MPVVALLSPVMLTPPLPLVCRFEKADATPQATAEAVLPVILMPGVPMLPPPATIVTAPLLCHEPNSMPAPVVAVPLSTMVPVVPALTVPLLTQLMPIMPLAAEPRMVTLPPPEYRVLLLALLIHASPKFTPPRWALSVLLALA